MRLDFLLSLMAPSGQGSGAGFAMFMFQMLAIFAIFYFLIIRPKVQQEKRHRARLSEIKRGDEVVTVGGIVGQVVHVKEDKLTVKSGESRLVVARERVATVATPGVDEKDAGA